VHKGKPVLAHEGSCPTLAKELFTWVWQPCAHDEQTARPSVSQGTRLITFLLFSREFHNRHGFAVGTYTQLGWFCVGAQQVLCSMLCPQLFSLNAGVKQQRPC